MTGDSPRYMYYVTDHLGNVRTVVDEDGNVCQVNHYYSYGDRFEDTRDMTVEESDNTRLFGGKEYSSDTGMHDFEARYDNTVFGRFTTIDPIAEKYYSVSPYSYCAGNPVNFVDPDGKETHVVAQEDGTYKVVGGIINRDKNIYLVNAEGNYSNNADGIRISIGSTVTKWSFYNSDKKQWAVGSVIDLNDKSGNDFLMKASESSLLEYIDKARTNHEWDFKVTNGYGEPKGGIDIYRGMPVSSDEGNVLIASARDIGNMAAGYLSGKNGISLISHRLVCDLYQMFIDVSKLQLPNIEGVSSRSAQRYGWGKGYFEYMSSHVNYHGMSTGVL